MQRICDSVKPGSNSTCEKIITVNDEVQLLLPDLDEGGVIACICPLSGTILSPRRLTVSITLGFAFGHP